MIVESFSAENFRNIENAVLIPDGGINIIYGSNAQGKTNLLEGMWLFTGYRSFRGSRDSELKRFGTDFSRLKLDYSGDVRKMKCEITTDDKRHVKRNGIELGSPSELLGEFLAVIFSPAHLSIIKDGPVMRRQFLDIAVSRHSPRYSENLRRYRHALSERNSLLKDLTYHSELYETCELWEKQLAFYGASVITDRLRYTQHLSEAARSVYDGLCSGRESFTLSYLPSFTVQGDVPQKEELAKLLEEKYVQARRNDIMLKATTVGPHRDDLSVVLNSKSARMYGSQGQQRSAALALKLGEAQLIKDFTGEVPVVLLDDVMSELDPQRQDYILNRIKDMQVFITCCEPSHALRARTGKEFMVSGGRVS